MAESVNCTHHIDFITNVVKFPAVCIVIPISGHHELAECRINSGHTHQRTPQTGSLSHKFWSYPSADTTNRRFVARILVVPISGRREPAECRKNSGRTHQRTPKTARVSHKLWSYLSATPRQMQFRNACFTKGIDTCLHLVLGET